MRRWFSYTLVALSSLVALGCGEGSSDGGPRGGTGGGGTGGGLSCETLVEPPAGCDDACPLGSDSECEIGTHCLNGACFAQCTATEGCGENHSCNSRGRCVPDIATGGTGGTGNAGGNACQSVSISPTRSIPNVMFLVDQSGSMDASFGGGLDRWQAAHGAITQIVSELDSVVRFGLTTYQSNGGGITPDECPIFDTQVDFAMDNLGAINMSYPANFPGGLDTPTGDAIDVLVSNIQSSPPPAEGPTIIVLATDGEPDSCEVPNPNPTAGARDEAVSASSASHNAGIDVFVLWVGTLSDADTQDHLKEVANVGIGLGQSTGVPAPGGEEPSNPAAGAPFWVGSNPSSLENPFRAIIGDNISCDIQMDKRFDDTAKACQEGDVQLGGEALSCPEDWQVKDGADDIIELVGDACDRFRAEALTFSASFPCGAIIVE